jgi:hypothetical protein
MAEKDLQDPGIAEKYLLDHQRREKKIADLLDEAETYKVKANSLIPQLGFERQAGYRKYVMYRLASMERKIDALLISFSVGEVDPEEPPPGGVPDDALREDSIPSPGYKDYEPSP